MANRLRALVPAMFQPTDPIAVDAALQDGAARKLTATAAVLSALLLVVLIAILMGTT
jgi:hypothetical protein